MTAIEIVIDDSRMVAALGRLRALAEDDTPIMRAIGVGLVEVVQQRFERAVDPQGRPWIALNPAYAATKRGPGILRETGMRGGLQGSITFAASRGQVVVGTNKRYARIHQFGGTIVPKNAKALVFHLAGGVVHAHKVTIPARPFLGFGAEDREVVFEVVEVFVRRALRD